jgi:hypothetical protein
MKRRYFFKTLASGIAVATAPSLFLPKTFRPVWKREKEMVALWYGDPPLVQHFNRVTREWESYSEEQSRLIADVMIEELNLMKFGDAR